VTGKEWSIRCKTSHVEVLSVPDLLPHLATAGKIPQQGYSLNEEPVLLQFYGFTHCTKLPRALRSMFLFGVVE